MPVVYGPDVNTPVGRHQSSCKEKKDNVPVAVYMSAYWIATNAPKQCYHEHHRPEHAVAEYFYGWYMLQQFPVQWEKSPCGVAYNAIKHTFFMFRDMCLFVQGIDI